MIKQYLQLPQNLFLLFTPCLASAFLASSPSLAATLAFSESQLFFTGFSHNPIFTDVNTEVDGMISNEGGNVIIESDPKGFFVIPPPEALGFSSSQAWGENQSYLGFAESNVKIKGLFNIKKDSIFSFNFLADLTLFTFIDNPHVESANAKGEISFALFDMISKSTLAFFSLSGNLTTKGDQNLIIYEIPDQVTLGNNPLINSNVGANQGLIQASFEGYLERYFADDTSLALIGFQKNRVQVQATVPEPSITIALIFSCALISVALKQKGQHGNSNCLGDKK